MKKLLVSLTTASVVFICTSAQATLLLYDPFDYTAGERLGGSGTSPVGKVAPNGQTWITRSPAVVERPYAETNDVLVTAGSLSYPGLAPSSGNSVRYGSSVDATGLYTDAIALPYEVTTDSIYYSAIVRFNGPNIYAGVRTSFAALSAETADPAIDAGQGLATSSGTANIPLPAGAWIRRNPSDATFFQLGSGKQNGDGMGPSASAPSWQSSAAGHPYPNQQGNTAGTNQDYATIADDIYFIVLKYTFDPLSSGNDDTVSMWINPIPTTLGDDSGEAAAGAAGGSYYSAINATVTPNPGNYYDAPQIRSFILLGLAQASASTTKSIDVTLDELRIGTTWADVTPAAPAPPLVPEIISIANAGTTSVTVTWTNVQIGTNYVLQYNTNLSTTNWTDLPSVTATNSTASQTDNPPSGDPARFYRVVQP